MTESNVTSRAAGEDLFDAPDDFNSDAGGEASTATLPYPPGLAKNFEPGTDAAKQRAKKIAARGSFEIYPCDQRATVNNPSAYCKVCRKFARRHIKSGCSGREKKDPPLSEPPLCFERGLEQ